MDRDKIIDIADYVDVKDMPDDENDVEKNKVKSFFKWIIAAIVTACISATVPYYLSPIHTNISTHQIGLYFGQRKNGSRNEILDIYFKDLILPRIEIYIDNNNDSFIRISDIYVNVIKYDQITENDIIYRPDLGGLGDIEKPIYLTTEIPPYVGTVKAEIDWDLNFEYGNNSAIIDSGSYIEIAGNTSDKFLITMNTNKQGYYSIEVEFCYKFHGTTHTIKTEKFDFIYLDMNYNDSQLYQLESDSYLD